MSSSNNSNTVLSPIDLNVLPSEAKSIYRPTHKYKLQDAISLRDQKQRWLSYLFKKKAPDFPVTAGDWAVKEMLISTIQRKLQEEAAQEVQEEVAQQEETRRIQEESPVLPLQQESPLEAPQNSQKKRKTWKR
ncbi:unnamed protein product [Rhizophagus irregularis]|nr:unnamed protein product [Rhizophagus irregularis]